MQGPFHFTFFEHFCVSDMTDNIGDFENLYLRDYD